MRRTSVSRKIFVLVNTIFLVAVALLCLLPLVNLFALSLSGKSAANSGIVTFWPVDFTLLAYEKTFQNNNFIRSILISFLRTGIGTVLSMCVITTAGYALSKDFKGRTPLMWFFVFTMLFSGGLIPFYLLIQDLHLMNNPLIYILPGLVSGFDIIIAKNFLSGISDSLAESAQLDGAGEYRIFFSIYLPLSGPIMATLALWSFVGKWNDWMTGLLYMQGKPDLQLIQTFLRRILNAATTQSGVADTEILNLSTSIRMAIVVVGMLPIVLMYPFVQKHFVKGVMLGSVKG